MSNALNAARWINKTVEPHEGLSGSEFATMLFLGFAAVLSTVTITYIILRIMYWWDYER